jgi:cytochrome bd-type quinol oxidase subunit 2
MSRRTILSIGTSVAVFLPVLVFAAVGDPIVPCDGVHCTCRDLATLANNILNWIIYLAVFGSALLFAYAGARYLTAGGDAHVTQEATNMLKNAAKGIIVALMAWLIVSTIVQTLASPDIVQSWNALTGCNL